MPSLKKYQSTIACAVGLEGLGLHTGKKVNMRVLPAEEDSGIVFRRIDLPGKPEMAADFDFVNSTFMCTCLDGKFKVSTVEHFLAAVSGLSLDNLIIELNDEELPILDGSAQPFVFLLQSCGIVKQAKKRKYLKLKKEFKVSKSEGFIELKPYDGLRISYKLDYEHPAFTKNNVYGVDFGHSIFAYDVASARTFGFMSDFSSLLEKGLIKGGSIDNALVFDENKLLNPEGFRFLNECARHKVLDVVGDLTLLGFPLLADVSCFKSGHTLNHLLVSSVMNDPTCYDLVEL